MTDNRERPTMCEIPGCRSVYCGKTSSGTDVFKCGKADIFIHQNNRIRGVCQFHYTQVTDRDGTSRMADLKDSEGNFDPVKVAACVPADAQVRLPMRVENPATQSIADLARSIADDLDSADAPPDWFTDRP